MITIIEYLLSKSNQKAMCDEPPEIGNIAYDQFGDDWVIKDFCSILNDKDILKELIYRYDESEFFESWLEDEFDEDDWKEKYKVDDVYAVAVSVPNNIRRGSTKKAVYVWGPDDLWYTNRNPEKNWPT